ncbi:MAG: PHP domain-containing protein [Bacteroidia bacterium]|nr:PHP domain-containing protein [Bacteroidia bacterium]MCX7651757.1 PHP domain-containing protein [Bacteroidia bacterium]MDW8416371.1 PHP domain-containing protein [Bacteroidia bacterium]
MRREAVIQALEALVARLELVEQQPFRLQAYQRLYDILSGLPESAWASSESLDGALRNYTGIGEGLRRIAKELYETGTTALLRELGAAIPESVLELRRLPGLGPKRVQELWRELGIASVDALAQAIERGKLNGRKGWSPSLLQRLQSGIQMYQSQRHLLLYIEALQVWEQAVAPLRQKGLAPVEVGEVRRALPLIQKIEGALLDEQAPVAETLGWQRISPILLRHSELPVQLWLVSKGEWAIELLRLTGPESFWQALSLRLPKDITNLSETEIFSLLGLPYILPAWRDWEDIFTLAESNRLPEPLTEAHIRGSVHVHTTYSDGADSLEAMAEAAQSQGWLWLGIADHSQRAAYARGLSTGRLEQQLSEIDKLNQRYGPNFVLLKGIEADILPDGRIDYDESIWRKLDFLVASVHEKLHMTQAEAMERLGKALTNPYVRVLGHWTGRLLRSRPGYPIDEEQILNWCAERQIAVEFNANPYRMEMDWRWVRRAAELGVPIILTTDAHSVRELDYWRSGLAVLQKGLLPPGLLLNARSEPPFLMR